MAFENEIKAAQKICDGWMKRSVNDMNYLIGLKKNGVAWEKGSIATVEQMLAGGDAAGALSAINEGRTWLKQYYDDAEGIYDKHHSFILGAPRAGTKGICETIGLKDAKSPAYLAVSKAMDKELISQTKQFKETEGVWTNDLKPKIDILMSKLDTLEKLAGGTARKVTAYYQQFTKDSKAYLNDMTKAMSALKVSMAEKILAELKSDPSQWVSGIAKARTDNYRIMVARAESMPKVMALADKNYNRILKSVPDDVKDQFIFKGAVKAFETSQTKILKEMREAEATFKMAMAMIAMNFPEVA